MLWRCGGAGGWNVLRFVIGGLMLTRGKQKDVNHHSRSPAICETSPSAIWYSQGRTLPGQSLGNNLLWPLTHWDLQS